jgi:hypothetical protein
VKFIEVGKRQPESGMKADFGVDLISKGKREPFIIAK